MTTAEIERKILVEIEKFIAAEFSKVNSYPLLYKKLTQFLYQLKWRKENFTKMMIILDEHGKEYFRKLETWTKKWINADTFDKAQSKKKIRIEVQKKIPEYHA